MKRTSFKNFVVVCGLVCGLVSCSVDEPKQKFSSFETITVKTSDILVPYKFSARMTGHNDVTITPQVSGQLMRILVSEGEMVRQGQTLFVVDFRDAQLELESAQANLQAALAAQNSAKLEYDSNKHLFEKKIVSDYMLRNSENAYKQAQAAVAQARVAVNRAKVNLGYCNITAPVSGVIGEIPVRVGDQVSPMTELTILSGNTKMYAEFSIPEDVVEEMIQTNMHAKDINKYISNLPDATFVLKNGTEYPYKGRVVSVSGVVSSSTGTLMCKVEFPNSGGQAYSGIQGTVVMPFTEKNVIVVPQSSVVRLQDKSLVYKVKADSTATAVEVTTEDAGDGKQFIVPTGLKVGDRIISVGANNVTEGQKVLFPKEMTEKK